MNKIHIYTIVLSLFSIASMSAQTVLAGWHTWDAAGNNKLDDDTPDEFVTGFTANAGVNVESIFPTVGGGFRVLTNSNSSLNFTWPTQSITTQSVASLRPAGNALRSLDFKITNNSGNDYTLTNFQFQYRRAEASSPATTAIELTHLGGQSDLSVANGFLITSAVPTGNYTWYNVDADLTDLVDGVIAVGESAAFRISLPNLSTFLNWEVDNVAISGAVVPEAKTYGLITGIVVLFVVMIRRQK